MRKPFQFKQFNIQDENSAMKVGTDAVVLGSFINPKNTSCILDIGTGSGIIALMMAQKSSAIIDAIDIDFGSIQDANFNFENSAWGNQLNAIQTSLSGFVKQSNDKYDLIVSNPPFFNNSLKSPSERKNLSKHTSTLSHKNLMKGVKNLIATDGIFTVIIPFDQMRSFLNIAFIEHFFCSRKLVIYPTPNKPANRVILELSSIKVNNPKEESLTIRDISSNFTEQYKSLTQDFYLNF